MIDDSRALVDGLNADSNGYVTLMIGRLGVSSSSDQWASKEYSTGSWAPARDVLVAFFVYGQATRTSLRNSSVRCHNRELL